jgi:hypothetical protein
MGDELKRAVAAAKANRWPVWAIEWRGRITQDVGTDYEQQPSDRRAARRRNVQNECGEGPGAILHRPEILVR